MVNMVDLCIHGISMLMLAFSCKHNCALVKSQWPRPVCCLIGSVFFMFSCLQKVRFKSFTSFFTSTVTELQFEMHQTHILPLMLLTSFHYSQYYIFLNRSYFDGFPLGQWAENYVQSFCAPWHDSIRVLVIDLVITDDHLMVQFWAI